jgi:hypothetical protein
MGAKNMIKPGLLLLFSILLQATTIAHAAECDFRPPEALLQPNAYSHYSFKPDTDNRAVESADLRDGVHIEISSSQCADFVIREISLIVPARRAGPDDKAWLSFARTEIGRLSRTSTAGDFSELQRFLVEARHIAPRYGTRSACKNHSKAPAGLCSWESMGGFIFNVRKSKGKLRISATEYVSG